MKEITVYSFRDGARFTRGLVGMLIGCAIAAGCASKKACGDKSCCPAPATTAPVAATPVQTTAPTPAALRDFEIAPADAKALLQSKADIALIDCRTAEEVAAGKIEGSTNIPLQEIDQREAELAPLKDKPIIVYCRSGSRSAKFVAALKEKGFSDVKSIAGGFVRWEKEMAAPVQ